MINFDSLTLSALAEELNLTLIGSRIHRVQQPTKHEILLTFRAQGTNKKLLISAHPKYSFIALLDHTKRQFDQPHQPPMFCMLLRKHMEGAKILDIKAIENERIVEIYFESFNELGDRVLMTLCCEIMGKYSNVILYHTSSKQILGCAHNVGEHMSSQRELAGSLPYVLPPQQNKLDLLEVNVSHFKQMTLALNEPIDKWLSNTFYYISLALARELCHVAGIEPGKVAKQEKLLDLYEIAYKLLAERAFNPSISKDMELFSLLAQDPSVEWNSMGSVNEMVDRYFYHHSVNDHIKQLKSTLAARVKREIKRINNKIKKSEETLEKADNANIYRHKADIINANLYRLSQGETLVTLENFYDNNSPIDIELDPLITPSQNAQKFYKLYNKARNSIDITEQRLEKDQSDKQYLESIIISIDHATDVPTLTEINDELNSLTRHKQKQQVTSSKKKEKIKVTKFMSSDGFMILVGRNNKQNDYLISKLAHHQDLWLHTQNMQGSHVIIQTDRGQKEVSEEALHEAALLAGYFSQGRHSSNVNVIYTARKFLKKPPASNLGYVTYSQEKTLYVNPLEEHVAPILETMIAED